MIIFQETNYTKHGIHKRYKFICLLLNVVNAKQIKFKDGPGECLSRVNNFLTLSFSFRVILVNVI